MITLSGTLWRLLIHRLDEKHCRLINKKNEMNKIFISAALPVFAALAVICSCQQAENISPSGDPNATTVNLNIRLQYPNPVSFDSAFVVFKNSAAEFKLRLTLDNTSHIATGRIADLPFGEWKVAASYFSTIMANHKSLEKTGVVTLQITPTATDLISTETFVSIKEKADRRNLKSFQWTDYYYHQLYLDHRLEGFLRLPQDPTNPFIEISTFSRKWTYAYADRSFFNRSSDGTSNYLQGSCAFEIYGRGGNGNDLLENHITDTTALAPGISMVRDKVWNYVNGIILMYDNSGNEFLLFHTWDLTTSGRVAMKRNHSSLH
jgi:hypothetical protein